MDKIEKDVTDCKSLFYYLLECFDDYNIDNPIMLKLRLLRIVLTEEEFFKAKLDLMLPYYFNELLKKFLMEESKGSSNGFNMFSYGGGVYNNVELHLNGVIFIKGGGGIIMYYDRDIFSDDEEYFN